MFHVQFHDQENNKLQTLKYKIEENSGGGDCLFNVIHCFLTSSEIKTNYTGKDEKDLRASIVNEVVSEKFEKLKFNHENEIPSISKIDLE